MRKLIMKMSASLDGYLSAPNEANDWIFKTADDQSKAWSLKLLQDSGLILVGRKSYEGWAKTWPTAVTPFAAPMNELPKAVFTQKGFKPAPAVNSTPAAASWADAKIYTGELTETIQKLKQEPGKQIAATGGIGFMRSLLKAGLIDEFHLAIHPVALGAGTPFITDLAQPLFMKLADVKSFPGGIVVHTYGPT